MNSIGRRLVVAAALAFALATEAAPKSSRNDGNMEIRVTETAVILGTTVAPGAYTLRWNREHGSESVNLEVAKGRKVVASGRGAWIESEQPSPYDGLVYRPENGHNALSEIRFKATTDTIRVGADGARAEAPSSSTPGSGSDK